MIRSAHRFIAIAFAAMVSFAAQPTLAHEVRPAYFELVEKSNGEITALWKQPLMDTLGVAIAPRLSSGWLDAAAQSEWQTPTHRIRQWAIHAPHAPLEHQQLLIDGLDKTITDVLVRIHYANGNEVTQLIKAERPQWQIAGAEKSTLPVAQYLALGVEHIWTGIDHLLYVLGLILLVGNVRTLLKTITAFTAAHSITLGAATLKIIPVSPAPVEAVIAFSILYVAAELVYARRGAVGLAQRAPWVIAFVFGLLHGFGFAGALAETGLPADNIPLALLLFNLGIEAGQLLFVVTVLSSLALTKHYWPRVANALTYAAPHAIGSVAACWFIERTAVAFHLISH